MNDETEIKVKVAVLETKQENTDKVLDAQSGILDKVTTSVTNLDKKVVRLAVYVSVGVNIATALVIWMLKDHLFGG